MDILTDPASGGDIDIMTKRAPIGADRSQAGSPFAIRTASSGSVLSTVIPLGLPIEKGFFLKVQNRMVSVDQ